MGRITIVDASNKGKRNHHNSNGRYSQGESWSSNKNNNRYHGGFNGNHRGGNNNRGNLVLRTIMKNKVKFADDSTMSAHRPMYYTLLE